MEVMVSSVKPFELMIGKITSIGLVGLTQLGIWILFIIGIFCLRERFSLLAVVWIRPISKT